jgi:hypothetical protein
MRGQAMEKTITEVDLAQFTGTEHYYRHWTKALVYTDGVKYLAEKAQAYWLLDLIASYQSKCKNIPFQAWKLVKTGDRAVVNMREDTDRPEVVRQELPFTDFPFEDFSLWLIDGVLLLPSEY